MSNFDFLKGFDDDLWKCGVRIEEQINKYPFGVHSEATAFLEYIVNNLRLSVGLKKSRKPFYNRIDEVYRKDPKKVSYKYKNLIYDAYQQRNKIHADLSDIEKDQYVIALSIHQKLYYIAKKYFEIFKGHGDEYKRIPKYQPPELDFSPKELQLIDIPDFNEIIEYKYDYCVVCGNPNHSNYSIYCEECNNLIDNANNFISIRNSFKDKETFTKEDLIEFGIHEGYVNSMISFLNKSELFNVKGRLISFNNSKLDSFIAKIDYYIHIGELITKFRQDKITPEEIKQTEEYVKGSFNQEPFKHFYYVINEEIMNKFEYELISTENIQKSIDYSTISQKDLNRWYNIQLNQYKRNNINEAFVIFNELLTGEYLLLKMEGVSEGDIQSNLNITKEMLEFFPKFRSDFNEKISQIKKNLVLQALSENKSKKEAIEFAGITAKEYDDIIRLFKDRKNEVNDEYERIISDRKEKLLINLTDNDLFMSCKLSNVTVDNFYEWYDESKIDSKFYIKSTKILMDKYLIERKTGKTKSEACESIGLKENIVDYWIKRKDKLYDKFQNDNVIVIVYLILEGFKDNKTKSQIAKDIEISVKQINTYLDLGQRESGIYLELFHYYENEVIPRNLSRFLVEIKNKTVKKALELSDLTMKELDKYYVEDKDFHDKYLNYKMDRYIDEILDGRNHETSLKRSNLSEDDYIQLKDEIDEIILMEKMKLVKKEIRNNRTTEVAAKNAKVTFDDIYDWYYKGKSDEEFKDFSEFFYEHYIRPNILYFNKLINDRNPLDKILEKFDINFTQKDFEIWQKEGLINKENVVINLKDDEDDEETSQSLYKSHKKLYQQETNENKLKKGYNLNSELYDSVKNDENETFFQKKDTSQNASILKKDEKDIEKLKKEMGIKDKK